MSDLQNPLFEEEKEFLERKKLEYERALRGDVDHIKDQSVKVGKIAAVGVGLAGGIWLITKAFGGKKKNKHNPYVQYEEDDDQEFDNGFGQQEFDGNEVDQDDEFGSAYYTAGNGKRYKSKFYRKSAADSARAFVERDEKEQSHEADELGFGAQPSAPENKPAAHRFSPYDTAEFEDDPFQDDPFQDMPYDDSRRLPASHAFDGEDGVQAPSPSNGRSKFVGEVLQSFLKSDTGKVLVGQVAAVALALVTKKVSEFFPAAKNSDASSDLATSAGYAPAETGFAPVASSVSLDSPDASTHSHSL